MKTLADAVRNVKKNAKTIDGEFLGLFDLSEKSIEDFSGTLEEVALAHAVLRLKKENCVCLACRSAAFDGLKKTILDADKILEQLMQEEADEECDDDDTGDKCG